MKTKILILMVFIGSLFLSSYATAQTNILKPSLKVQSLIDKYQLEIVDYNYTKKAISKGTRKSAKAVIIDARPELKYKKGAIPSSINIPDTKFEKYYSQIKDLDKNKEIIVYCGGWNCAKSPKLAKLLQKKGFKNIKLYQAGEPEWIKKNYKEVDLIVLKSAQKNNSALIIDARPYNKYLQETIPGAISIPDTKMNILAGRFPTNKDEKIIVFCGGYTCTKSHNVANKLVSLNYKKVSVYSAGLPAWKKEGLQTTKSLLKTVKNEEKTKNIKYSKNGLKLGSDEGTVAGEWFKKLVLEDKVPSYVQIIDVTTKDEFNSGHLNAAVNIEAGKLKAKELFDLLPKNKTVVFNCTAGGRSTEAWSKLNDENYNMSEIYYFDANIDCKGNKCKIEVNEPLE